MRVAVITDIHANYYALRAAVDSIKSNGVDEVIFLGDLLSYGCHVNECIELLKELSLEKRVVCIKGNHDQIYFNAQAGLNYEYKPLPTFIKDSIEYTLDILDYNLLQAFDWKESYKRDGVFFAHANAARYGDWHYLDSDEKILGVADQLKARGFKAGFFGHVHRNNMYAFDGYSSLRMNPSITSVERNDESILVACVGSIGQPRGDSSSYCVVEIGTRKVSVKTRLVSYEIKRHLESIKCSAMSVETKNRLCSYFEGGRC